MPRDDDNTMKIKANSGQTLITLLIFMIIAITITTAAIAMSIVNAKTANALQDSSSAFHVAEGGAENAVLRLLRDPNYNGETLDIGEGTASVTVTRGETLTVTSEGKMNDFVRKVQISTSLSNGLLTILSWKEIF